MKRKMLRKFSFWTAISSVFFILIVSSTMAKKINQLSLQQAVEMALKTHPMIQAAEEQVLAAKQGKKVARSNFFPRLNLNETYMRTNDPVAVFGMNMWQGGNLGFTDLFQDFMDTSQAVQSSGNQEQMNNFIQEVDQRFYDVDDQGDFHTQIEIMQPIFNGGKELIGYEIAKLNQKMMEKQKERIKDYIIFGVVQSYLNIYLSQKGLQVVKKAKESATEHLRLAQSHFAAGTVVESDLLRAKVHLASIDEMWLTSLNRTELAQFSFKRAIGISPDQAQKYTISLNDVTQSDMTFDGEQEPDLIKKALIERTDLQAMEHGVEIFSQMVKMEKTEYYPNLNAWFHYNIHNDDQFEDSGDNWMVGASVKLNLFNGLNTQGRVLRAKSQLKKMKLKQKDLKQQSIFEVQNAYRNFQTARARIEVSKKVITAADETLRIINRRYKSGVIPFIHVIDAEVAQIQAETNYIQALHDVKLAAAQIALSIGRIQKYIH